MEDSSKEVSINRNSSKIFSGNKLSSLEKNIKDKHFNQVIEIEEHCFFFIKFYRHNLSFKTNESLIYLYGRSVAYLLSRGSELYPQWIGGSLQIVGKRVQEVLSAVDDKIKDHVHKLFSEALSIKVLCGEENEIFEDLYKKTEEQKKEITIRKTKDKIDTVANTGSLAITVGGASIALLTGPIGWLALVPIITSAGYLASSEYYKKSRDTDYENFYAEIFRGIEYDMTIVQKWVNQEVSHAEVRRKEITICRQIEKHLNPLLNKDYERLLHKANKSEGEKKLLEILKKTIEKNKKAHPLLSDIQKKALEKLGFNISSINEKNLNLYLKLIKNVVIRQDPYEILGKEKFYNIFNFFDRRTMAQSRQVSKEWYKTIRSYEEDLISEYCLTSSEILLKILNYMNQNREKLGIKGIDNNTEIEAIEWRSSVFTLKLKQGKTTKELRLPVSEVAFFARACLFEDIDKRNISGRGR